MSRTYPRPAQSAFGDPPHLRALAAKAEAAEQWPHDVTLPDGTVIGRETIQCWADGVPFAEDLMAKALAAVLRSAPWGRV